MISLFLKGEARIFHQMGFFSDQAGILRRYRREASQWEHHLHNTRDFILSAAAKLPHNKIAILGSGWLLDVPYHELANNFDEVWLFDIRHSNPVKKLIKSFPNIFLKEVDLSGFAKVAWNLAPTKCQGKKIDFDLSPVFDFDLSGFDCIVSCNLLNQLDILIVDFLQAHFSMTEIDEQNLRSRIQQAHLELLPKGKSCLISDIEELWIDKKGLQIGNKKLVHVELPFYSEPKEWVWHFDNHCTYHPSHHTWFRVKAGIL